MIIVTGAAGFIGANIVATLNERGRTDILAVDNPDMPAETQYLHSLKVQHFLPKAELPAWLEKNAHAVDGIIHMGACSDTTNADRAFMLENNTKYTRKLWDFCTHQQKRFVYASSAATYGDGSNGYDDAADPKQLKPLNIYGESKQLFDLFALEQKSTPAGWAGLKFFNVYGPRENHKKRMASVAFHSFNQIKQSGKVKLFKSDRPGIPDGGQQRDFIYVKDCVAAVLHFFNAPKESAAGLYNVGTGQARSFADLARAVFRALKLELNIEYIDMPADLKGKYQYFTQATVEKLRGSGFTQPFHTLEDGVADYVAWLERNSKHEIRNS
ncbi:MAG TPA: ADP-glyceromanno-heptose 6-epimerase [Planctomycetota bacterium]|nr:ADP-glyceromanno-heptose 6-epimerase [Planctomycetota bacterium]